MKKACLTFDDGKTLEYEYLNESSLYKGMAERTLKQDVIAILPFDVDLQTPDGSARYKVVERGSYIEDGVTYPSVYVIESFNSINLPVDKYPTVYLSCIHPESNNYKAYQMEQLSDGKIDAIYGSIDVMANGRGKHIKTPYESRLFWIRYYEKLSKGYKDTSDVYLSSKIDAVKSTKKATTPTTANEKLYKQLYTYANKIVETTLAFKPTYIQVKKARAIWNKLGTYKTVRAFNKHLQELMLISPRKRDPLHDDVSRFLANDKTDFSRILNFEEDLLLAMEGVVGQDNSESSNSFKNMGIEVFIANDKQKEEVMNALGNSHLAKKVKTIYRVKPLKQEKAFAKYCKEHHVKKIKKLWHGSRSENWASIVINSLLLNPNAVITGKMFGKGIYFAPSPSKSWGYTSYYGSRWANGNSNTAFMGLYAVAYGNPLMVTSSGEYSSTIKNSNDKYHCVHATPTNTNLLNDEIVLYNENAVCLNYLVEFN